MDQKKTGELIRLFRTKMGYTQKQLAERINVSDKAVSKWECGNGCSDISLLNELADVFGTDVNVLLSGEVEKNESEKCNMKKTRFYVCKECGNIIASANEASVICCGRKLTAEEARKAEDNEKLRLEETGAEWFVSSDHEMTKEHYISFAAYVNGNSVMIFKQYPEWDLQFRMPLFRSGRLVWYCTKCGMMYMDIGRKKDQ